MFYCWIRPAMFNWNDGKMVLHNIWALMPPAKGEWFFLKAWFLYSINFGRCLHLNHLSRWSSPQAGQWHKSWDCDTEWSTNAWVGVENTFFLLVSVTPFADVSIWYFVNSDIKDCGACDAQVEGFLLLPYPKCLGRTGSSCIPFFLAAFLSK